MEKDSYNFLVFNSTQIDKDKDGFVSLAEFMKASKTDDFEKDEGWKSVEEEQPYTDDELAEFERQIEEEQRKERETAETVANVANKLVQVHM